MFILHEKMIKIKGNNTLESKTITTLRKYTVLILNSNIMI